MVLTVCKTTGQPQGITHCASAFWLAPSKGSQHANLVVARTTLLEVYSVLHHPGSAPGAADAGPDAQHVPTHTLLLEYSQTLNGEVQAMATLPSRRPHLRDAIILAFDHVRIDSQDERPAAVEVVAPSFQASVTGTGSVLLKHACQPQDRVYLERWAPRMSHMIPR
jgi:hypothetical protein